MTNDSKCVNILYLASSRTGTFPSSSLDYHSQAAIGVLILYCRSPMMVTPVRSTINFEHQPLQVFSPLQARIYCSRACQSCSALSNDLQRLQTPSKRPSDFLPLPASACFFSGSSLLAVISYPFFDAMANRKQKLEIDFPFFAQAELHVVTWSRCHTTIFRIHSHLKATINGC